MSADYQTRGRRQSEPRPGARSDRVMRGRRGRRASRIGRRVTIAVLATAALVLIAAGWLLLRPPASTSAPARGGVTAVAKAKRPSPAPTAIFAHVASGRVAIHFPASSGDLIAVGFHQAYNPKASAFVPTMKTLAMDQPPVTGQLLASDSALKLFEQASRYRGSPQHSAADCAVRPKARILSPVTGTVTLVKRYKLERRIDDVQLEIRPDGAPLLRLVMIHIKGVTVKAGDRVVGGVTPVATVRHLALDSSVNRYLPVSPADHTHIQVNDQRYRLPSS